MTPYHFSRTDVLAKAAGRKACETPRVFRTTRKAVRGVTLIEVIIYLALFGLLIGGAVVAAFNLFEANSRAQTKAMLQEEGLFLLGKIEWVISGAQAVTSPAPGAIGTSLVVSKWDTSIGNPIVITLTNSNMMMSTSSNAAVTLNNTNVSLSSMLFAHALQAGAGTNPETVQFSFTLSARTPNGMMISQTFPTTTISLRR